MLLSLLTLVYSNDENQQRPKITPQLPQQSVRAPYSSLDKNQIFTNMKASLWNAVRFVGDSIGEGMNAGMNY